MDLYKQFGLAGRTAIVTGAGEGIGRGIAIGLAEAGADLVLCGRRHEKLEEVQEIVEKLGRKAAMFVLDLRKVGELQGLAAFLKTETGGVDILVNNAGYVVTKPAWDVSEADWDAMLDTGFKGLFFCCQAVGALMRERGYGKIINLSSTFSKSIVPGRAIYAGLKAGINHLTEALAMEWAVDGIRVNALAPTAVRTPSRQADLQGPILERLLARIPLGRLATTEDLLGAVLYLASAASDFVTGQTLFVDGGWVAAS